MRYAIFAMAVLAAHSASAEILVPVRTIRSKEIIGPDDLTRKNVDISGAVSELSEIVGQEALVVLYPGRPVRPGDFGPPAIIGRNDLVTLVFVHGTLRIATEGRSLGRGAPGEMVRAMNMASRTTVTGRILANGSIEVQ